VPEQVQIEVVLLVLALGLFALVLVTSFRRRLQTRGPGRCACALRHRGRWRSGTLRYRSDRLLWSPRADLGLRSVQVLTRRRLRDVRRAVLDAGALPSGVRSPDPVGAVLTLSDGTVVELAMDRPAYNGLATWYEAAPPDAHPQLT
jgi:hypothetical protein